MNSSVPGSTHGVRDVVLSCIDYRFRSLIAAWIKEELHDHADLIAVAGAAKAMIDPASQEYVLGLLKIACELHGVTTVHMLNHVDCGAYGGSKLHADETREKHFHADQCAIASEIIKQQFPDLIVKLYLVDFYQIGSLQAELSPKVSA